MPSFAQAVALALLQGITELFPISSLGHSVLVPKILGWGLDQTSPQFLGFIVATHLGTALVLFAFFWRDWVRIIFGVLRSLYTRKIQGDPAARLGWLIITATIPAGSLGLLLQSKIQTLFGAGEFAAVALFCNGLMLFGAEALRKRAPIGIDKDEALAGMTFVQSLIIGLAQIFALIPGISRTGVSMTGGLLSGLSRENAARFAFLLATPIILAASVLEIPKIIKSGAGGIALVGVLCAGAAAYVSVVFLTNYFKTKTLRPFAIYCIAAGLFAILWLGLY